MPRLGDILLNTRHLTESQLQTALKEQARWGGLLGEVLLRMSYVTEPVLVDALVRQTGVPLAEPSLLRHPELAAKRRLPYELARKLRSLPLQNTEKGKVLSVAMVEPQNLTLLDELRKATGCRISPRLIGPQSFLTYLTDIYGAEEFVEEQVESSFKMLDTQGRTLIKDVAEIEREARASSAAVLPPLRQAVAASPPPVLAPAAVGGSPNPGELLKRLEEGQRQEVAALRAMVELLIERGVFSREDYLARVRK